MLAIHSLFNFKGVTKFDHKFLRQRMRINRTRGQLSWLVSPKEGPGSDFTKAFPVQPASTTGYTNAMESSLPRNNQELEFAGYPFSLQFEGRGEV